MALADQQVIVNTECKARGSFSYTKPNLAAALDIFFVGDDPDTFHDADCDVDQQVSREDAELAFGDAGEVGFYNSEGEFTKISADPSAN